MFDKPLRQDNGLFKKCIAEGEIIVKFLVWHLGLNASTSHFHHHK